MPRAGPTAATDPYTERFAPSPTGRLHLGHAYSALLAHDAAKAAGGRFLLRIEDLDGGRAREEHVVGIEADLAWLGLAWERPCLRQSTRAAAYRAAAAQLEAAGLVYPCFCTRRDIAMALDAPQEGVSPTGPDGLVYPGTCRRLTPAERGRRRADGAPFALRLDMAAAVARLGGAVAVAELGFEEIGFGAIGARALGGPVWVALEAAALIEGCGDVILARKDAPASYHLAVVVDDAHQGVSCVTRGEDLFEAAKPQRLLQALLGLPTPRYRHHRLIRDADGRRLAKRDAALGLDALRAAGWTPEQVRARAFDPTSAGAPPEDRAAAASPPPEPPNVG